VSSDFEQTGFLFGSNSVFIEELYQKYLEDPSSIDSSWVDFFKGQVDFAPMKTTSRIIIKDKPKTAVVGAAIPGGTLSENSLRAKFMIMAYREHGQQLADLDPLTLEVKKTHAELKLSIEGFGFSADQLHEQVDVAGELVNISVCMVGGLRYILDKTYSGSVAVEFSHVETLDEQKWLYEQLEVANTHSMFSDDD